MPTQSSSPIDPAIGHLASLAKGAEDPPGLPPLLAKVADPRHRRGVRHRLAVILGLAVWAVRAGAGSCTAIAEWGADADRQILIRLGVTGRCRRRNRRSGGRAFDQLTGRWAAQRTRPRPRQRRIIAVDGKTLHDSGHGEDRCYRLAALDHAHGPGPVPRQWLGWSSEIQGACSSTIRRVA